MRGGREGGREGGVYSLSNRIGEREGGREGNSTPCQIRDGREGGRGLLLVK